MKHFVQAIHGVAIAALLAVTTPAHAEFRNITVKGAKSVYQQVSAIYTQMQDKCLDQRRDWRPTAHTDPDCAFVVFNQFIANGWIVAHKPEALAKAAKKHQPQASPEDVWELPYANDWLGCMNYQFKNPAVFALFHFETFLDHPAVLGWIDDHKDIAKTEDGAQFVEQLKNIDQLAATCEDIIRDQPPDGALNVNDAK